MEKFKFNGDWEFDLALPAFDVLNQDGSQFSINVEIECLLNDDPDPLPNQVDALNKLVQNQDEIIQNIYASVKAKYPELEELYGVSPENDEYEKWFPRLHSIKDLGKAISLFNLNVGLSSKRGLSYLEFAVSAQWDEEHHMELYVLGNQVQCFDYTGGCNVPLDIIMGDVDDYNSQATRPDVTAPYVAHPKYGKLKPWQKAFNESREIYYFQVPGWSTALKEKIDNGELDPNGKLDNRPYVNIAAEANNLNGLKVLIESGAEVGNAICDAYNTYKEKGECFNYLLSVGGSIDVKNEYNRSILERAILALYSAMEGRAKNVNDSYLERNLEAVDRQKKEIVSILKLGAKNRFDYSLLPAVISYDDDSKSYRFELDWLLTNYEKYAPDSTELISFRYDRFDKVVEQGTHVKGSKHGKILFLNQDNGERREVHYHHGIRHGEARYFSDEGSLKLERNYRLGLLHGREMGYFKNGQLKYEHFYEQGTDTGVSKTYYENGVLKNKTEYGSDPTQKIVSNYYPGGILSNHTEHKNTRDVWQKVYTEAGDLVLEGPLESECRTGLWKAYNSSGQRIAELLYHKIGNQNEYQMSSYHTNGGLMEKFFCVSGQRHGECLEYLKSGQLRLKSNYKKDLLHGEVCEYYPSGALKVSGHYKENEQCGLWKVYAENGNLIKQFRPDGDGEGEPRDEIPLSTSNSLLSRWIPFAILVVIILKVLRYLFQ